MWLYEFEVRRDADGRPFRLVKIKAHLKPWWVKTGPTTAYRAGDRWVPVERVGGDASGRFELAGAE